MNLTPSIVKRLFAQIDAYGGIERMDFLDLSDPEFDGFVTTLWWGRKLP